MRLMPPTARGLVGSWAFGLFALALIAWGPPGLLRRAGEALMPGMAGQRAQTEGRRQDSVRAVQMADSERAVRGDSIRAVVFVPPDPLQLEERSWITNHRLMRIAFFVAIPIALVLNTVQWRRRRKRMFD